MTQRLPEQQDVAELIFFKVGVTAKQGVKIKQKLKKNLRTCQSSFWKKRFVKQNKSIGSLWAGEVFFIKGVK